MGADLYIESLHDEQQRKYSPLFERAVQRRNAADKAGDKAAAAEYQKEVSEYYDKMNEVGYFRDSYNGTSLFWLLGLSWWGDGNDMLDDKGYLRPENAKMLLKIVKATKLPKLSEPDLKGMRLHLDDTETVDAWNEYFRDKKQQFILFLETAIALDEPIRCSV